MSQQTHLCPKCNHRFKADSSLSGQKVKCPSCQQSIKLPGMAVQPAKDQPQRNAPKPEGLSLSQSVRPNPAGTSPTRSSAPPPQRTSKSERDRTNSASPTRRKDLTLAPIEAKGKVEHDLINESPRDVLARAERELKEASAPSDVWLDDQTKNWFIHQFGFLRDSQVIASALATGLILSGLYLFAHWAASDTSPLAKLGRVLSTIVMVVIFFPLMGYILTCGMAILDATANRLKRAREWPAMDPSEWLADAFTWAITILLAGAPGSLIGYLLMTFLGTSSIVGIYLIFLSIWGLGPPLLLGILDNQSILQPVSKTVIGSFHSRASAWQNYYLVSAVLLAILGSVYVWNANDGWIAAIVTGLSTPWLIFYLFHRLGIVARALGDVETPARKGD